MKIKTFIMTMLCAATLLFSAVIGTAVYRGDKGKFVPVCQAKECAYGDIYDMLTPKVIELYEQEIAKTPVLSNMPDKQLERLASRLKIPYQKAKAVVLLQNLIALNGDSVNISDLAAMSTAELMKCAKKNIEKYCSTLSEAELNDLKQKAKQALK